MKTFAAGAAVLSLFILANVVAAGVFHVLGPLVPQGDDLVVVAGMLLVGAIAVACAVLFFLGALRHLPPSVTRRPR